MSPRLGVVSLSVLVVTLVACQSSEPPQDTRAAKPAAIGKPMLLPPPPATVSTEGAMIPMKRVRAQTVYVPIYSHIYYRDRSRTFDLTATLSIRNTDQAVPLTVTSIGYYDTDGKLVREYVAQPLPLAPLATVDFIVEEQDASGGSGAKFLVQWQAAELTTEPIVEAVMVNSSLSIGLAFVSSGRVIREWRE